MRVGILGSGLMAATSGRSLRVPRQSVVLSYSRSSKKLEKIARRAGTTRGARPGGRAGADALLLACIGPGWTTVLRQAGDGVGQGGRELLLPMNADDTGSRGGPHLLGAEELARKVPAPESSPRSAPCPARSCSACSKLEIAPPGRAWCIAVTTRRPRRWPRR